MAQRDSRDGRDGRRFEVRSPKFEVFGTSNPELRTSDRACRARRARRALGKLAEFSAACSLRRGRSCDTIRRCDTALFRAQPP